MQAAIITISLLLLMICCGSSVAEPRAQAPIHRMRHGCNSRIVRDIMRRACAYHSFEENGGPDGSDIVDERRWHIDENYVETGRIRKEMELLYIRRILSECCPNQNCPPLSKFCHVV